MLTRSQKRARGSTVAALSENGGSSGGGMSSLNSSHQNQKRRRTANKRAAVVQHEDAEASDRGEQFEEDSSDMDEQRAVQSITHHCPHLDGVKKSKLRNLLDPAAWSCHDCNSTESVWG